MHVFRQSVGNVRHTNIPVEDASPIKDSEEQILQSITIVVASRHPASHIVQRTKFTSECCTSGRVVEWNDEIEGTMRTSGNVWPVLMVNASILKYVEVILVALERVKRTPYKRAESFQKIAE